MVRSPLIDRFLTAVLFMLEFHYPSVGQVPRACHEPSSDRRSKVLQSVDCYQVVLWQREKGRCGMGLAVSRASGPRAETMFDES